MKSKSQCIPQLLCSLMTIMGILGGAFSPASAQQDLGLHLDKPFYVTGEVAWFTLYLPITFLDKNIAVETSIVDGDGKQQDRFFLRNAGRTWVHGYYKIPYNSQAGIFEIQFRVSKGDVHSSELLAAFDLPVYNDLANLSNIEIAEPQKVERSNHLDALSISVELPKQISPREEVTALILVRDSSGSPVQGSFSIAVTDHTLTSGNEIPYENIQFANSSVNGEVDQLKNDLFIQGRLGDEEEPQQVNVLGGYIGDHDKIYYSKSYESGFFSMKLPDFYGKKRIQFIGFQREISEITATVDHATRINDQRPIIFTDRILDYLKFSRMRKKIYQYFESQEMPLEFHDKEVPKQKTKPDLVFNIKEYESFPDVKGFFGEILTTLTFKLQEDSTYTATLYNPRERTAKNTNLKGPPLFIIDGKMTRNADFVANLSMTPIERVEIYSDPVKLREYYQAIGISGVVKIETSLVDIEMHPADAEDVHTAYGLQPTTVFPEPTESAGREPQMRPQIYWNPAVSVDAGGEASTSFKHTDDTGVFSVEVFFQATDGRTSNIRHNYHVSHRP